MGMRCQFATLAWKFDTNDFLRWSQLLCFVTHEYCPSMGQYTIIYFCMVIMMIVHEDEYVFGVTSENLYIKAACTFSGYAL